MGGKLLVSDKLARLKPCRRCGYSLTRIAGARNCPECGLAVRISLSDNSGLEWSSPTWQRFMAVAFGVLALGLLCRMLSSTGYWAMRLMIYRGEYNSAIEVLLRVSDYAAQAALILYGVGLMPMAKNERRYPDESRGARLLVLGWGVAILCLGLIYVATRNGGLSSMPAWAYSFIWLIVSRPVLVPVLAVLAYAFADPIAKRGQSRLLSKLVQVPLYPAAAGVMAWLLGVDEMYWPIRSVVCDWLFPLSMIAMLSVTVVVLLRGAREAEQNWCSD